MLHDSWDAGNTSPTVGTQEVHGDSNSARQSTKRNIPIAKSHALDGKWPIAINTIDWPALA